MRGVIVSILIPVLLGLVTAAAQLPPEIMADRYLVRVERLMAEKNHEAALEMMDKIIALQKEHNLTVPDEFHFKYAQIAFSAGAVKAALDSVNKYLAAAGREGRFYREALELLDEAEQNLPENVAARFLRLAEGLISVKLYGDALEVMNRIVALQREHNLTLPEEFQDEFHYVNAQVALSSGKIKTAKKSAKKYLEAGGAAGKYRRKALELLEEAEQQILMLKPAMVAVPGGSFQMGCVSGKNCEDDEKPVHEVRIASFELSKHEVTFEKYDRFTAETGRERADDEGWGRGRRPVINVSWEDAVAYTEWLSAKLGEHYRLPTEAEWEYAARSGSVTRYHFGNNKSQLCRYANHADRSTDYDWRNKDCSDGVGEKTATVGSYQPNGFGLHDMHGNVWEWVQDCWNDSYLDAPTDGSAWTSGDCERRVLRGGSWFDLAQVHRAAYRHKMTTGGRDYVIGFRVARTLTP